MRGCGRYRAAPYAGWLARRRMRPAHATGPALGDRAGAMQARRRREVIAAHLDPAGPGAGRRRSSAHVRRPRAGGPSPRASLAASRAPWV